jgi:hypothetical protein
VSDTPDDDGRSGRRALLVVGLAGVLSGAVLGAFAGSNRAADFPTVDLFGVLTVETSGTTLGLFGALVGLVIVVVLFGLMEAASRMEDGRGGPGGPGGPGGRDGPDERNDPDGPRD